MNKCPRCLMPAEFTQVQSSEHYFTCNICGYYSAKSIEKFVDGVPITQSYELRPMGVIVTTEANIQYFTPHGRWKLLKQHPKAAGYTFYKEEKWYYHDIKQNKTFYVEEVLETIGV